MRERIAYLGGSLEIERAPRGGTRLRVRVPLRGMARRGGGVIRVLIADDHKIVRDGLQAHPRRAPPTCRSRPRRRTATRRSRW